MSKTYRGLLSTPRKPWGPLPILGAEEELERRKRQDAEEFLQRLGLLLDHYDIPRDAPNGMAQLLYALLLAHVPGFKVARGRGADPFWTPQRQVQLAFDVQHVIDGGKDAAVALRDPELLRRYQQDSAESLRRRYEEAKRSPVVQALEKLGAGRLSPREIADVLHSERHKGIRE